MALINCPECSKNVSSIAAACPDCGYPIFQARTVGTQNIDPATIIEQTSKHWKTYKLAALALIIIGLILIANSSSIGVWLLFAGLITAIYSVFGSWWHHS